MKDYSKLTEVTVKTQEDLDNRHHAINKYSEII